MMGSTEPPIDPPPETRCNRCGQGEAGPHGICGWCDYSTCECGADLEAWQMAEGALGCCDSCWRKARR